MKSKSLQTNAYGYPDPTAYNAIIKADSLSKEKIDMVLEDIFKVCKKHGVVIYGDISFVDRKTKSKAKRHFYNNE